MKFVSFKKERVGIEAPSLTLKKCGWKIIGTLYGFGYDCRTNSTDDFDGYKGGIWNKVSYWADWIKQKITELNEPICSP